MAKDKKKTQEPENFDEEVKFLVSAWLRVGESRVFQIDSLLVPQALGCKLEEGQDPK